MSSIHTTALIHPDAVIGENVTVGPYVVIGPHCTVGDNSVLSAHVVLESHVKLGKNCQVASGAILGGLPQDHSFGGETSWVDIGDDAQIREYVTINRGTGEGTVTRLGNHCMVMAYSHIAHNCQLGDHVTMANGVQLAGHAEIGDGVFISGTCLVHQFVKIGRLSFICPFSGTRQDVPPFAMTEGRPQVTVVGTNKVGLKRAGFTLDERKRIKKAYQLLFFSKLNVKDAIDRIHAEMTVDAPIQELMDFVANSKRGIHKADVDETDAKPASGVASPV